MNRLVVRSRTRVPLWNLAPAGRFIRPDLATGALEALQYDPIGKARRYQKFANDLIERAASDPNRAGLLLIAERYLVLAERELKRPVFAIVGGDGPQIVDPAPRAPDRPQLEIVDRQNGAPNKLRTGSR